MPQSLLSVCGTDKYCVYAVYILCALVLVLYLRRPNYLTSPTEIKKMTVACQNQDIISAVTSFKCSFCVRNFVWD